MTSLTSRAVVGLGLVSALAVAFFIGRGRGEAGADARGGARPEEVLHQSSSSHLAEGTDRTDALEREIARLRREVRENYERLDEKLEGAPGEPEARPAEHEVLNMPTAEEEEKMVGERFAGFAARHQADPVWSSGSGIQSLDALCNSACGGSSGCCGTPGDYSCYVANVYPYYY